MLRWPHELVTYSPHEVQLYCVGDELWQHFRLQLKGLSTEHKLNKLFERYESLLVHAEAPNDVRRLQVQTSNYINALKRGGQLSMDLRVQR